MSLGHPGSGVASRRYAALVAGWRPSMPLTGGGWQPETAAFGRPPRHERKGFRPGLLGVSLSMPPHPVTLPEAPAATWPIPQKSQNESCRHRVLKHLRGHIGVADLLQPCVGKMRWECACERHREMNQLVIIIFKSMCI